jgi:hypothetical protein
MNQAIRSSVLPAVWLLMHATAGAQAPAPNAVGAPVAPTEVFVEDARWVSAVRGAVPAGAIAHGHEPDGRPEFVCRAWSGSGLHLGKVSQGGSGCTVVSRDRPVTLARYQVLTLVAPRAEPPPRESVRDLIHRRWAESGRKR